MSGSPDRRQDAPGQRLWFHLDPASGVPLHVQLRNQVRAAVASGVLRSGDRLPSVRELALQLTVNPNTVFKVYQELEHEGLLETVHGKGVFVRPTAGRRFSDEERWRLLAQAIDHLVAQAVALGYSTGELRRLVDQRLQQRWSQGQEGRGHAGRQDDAGGPDEASSSDVGRKGVPES